MIITVALWAPLLLDTQQGPRWAAVDSSAHKVLHLLFLNFITGQPVHDSQDLEQKIVCMLLLTIVCGNEVCKQLIGRWLDWMIFIAIAYEKLLCSLRSN